MQNDDYSDLFAGLEVNGKIVPYVSQQNNQLSNKFEAKDYNKNFKQLPDGSYDYGKRADGSQKGKGWLGMLQRNDGGVSSEISIGVNIDGKEVEIPSIVPTLTEDEVAYLLSMDVNKDDIPESIVNKAVEFARGRISKGQSPFASIDRPKSESENNNYSDLFEGLEVNGEYIQSSKEKAQESKNALRQELLNDIADDAGAWDSFFIGMGRGINTVGRGFGLVDKEDPIVTQAVDTLKEKRPYSTGGGEIVGEALPFVLPGSAVGSVASLPARVALTGAVGATEGGVLANAKDQSVVQGTAVGLSLGAGAEIIAPVIGRLGRKLYSKVRGKAPSGSLLDEAGKPTSEFQQVLDESGITYDDLATDAQEFIAKQSPGANPEQAARAAQFSDLGIPASRSDITQGFADRATEQKLMQSASDPIAEQFRQYKLTQSEAIKARLQDLAPNSPITEETGELIKDALIGRKKLLRTQKNALYSQAADAADQVGGIPMFTDNIKSAVPDADTLDDLAITAPQAAQSLQGILKRYGIIDPSPQEIESGFKTVPLDMKSYERLRKSINAIERGDNTGAISVATGPIKNALDTEAAELGETLAAKGFGDDIVAPLREARNVVRQMKTEFSPQSVTGRLIDTKKDGVTNIIESSSVYNKLSAKSMPVENVRKVMASLKSSGDNGKQAIASLQSTTLMDLIDSGFSTQSRKIDGVPVFNPIAFKNRVNQLGEYKLRAIFSNNPQALSRIKNIDKIATLVTPTSDAVPKGSGAVIMDLMNRLGVIGITSKVPGGGALVEVMTGLSNNSQTRKASGRAMTPKIEVQRIKNMIDESFPGIASATGIAVSQQQNEEEGM